MEVEASELVNYVGKRFIYEDTINGVKVRAEGLLVSVETYTSDFGYGDHIVTYMDVDGELTDFFVFGYAKFKLMN